jgi:hypothetical protein
MQHPRPVPFSEVYGNYLREDASDIWEGCSNTCQHGNNKWSAALSDDDEQRAEEVDHISSDHFDDDDCFGFMGDNPSFTLTPAEQAVVSHAPLVRAKMVVCNAQRQEVLSFLVSEIVTDTIPKGEWSSGDILCFFCCILSNPHGHFYEVKCENRTLRPLFLAGELQEVPPKVVAHYQSIISLDRPHHSISLAAVARLAQSSLPPAVTCKCKGECRKGQCSCMKARVQCSKNCHGPSSCQCSNAMYQHDTSN